MHMIPKVIVVVYGATRVEDNVFSNGTTWVHYSAGADHGASANRGVRCNDGTWVASDEKALPFDFKFFEQASPDAIVTYGDNYGVMFNGRTRCEWPQNREPQKMLPMKRMAIIQEA
jgi:hypothetical protein